MSPCIAWTPAPWNFEDSTFDTVVAAYVVTAVPDYRKVVSEMIRVCRPGGRIIMLNHFSNENKMVAAVEKVISPLTKHLGWRTDLSLNNVLEGTALHVARKQNVNPLRFLGPLSNASMQERAQSFNRDECPGVSHRLL